MPYDIIWSIEAAKDLRALDRSIARWIMNKLDEISSEDELKLKKLTGRDLYKLRVGDYRILIDVDQEAERLHVLTVGHRKNIYKQLK